MKKKSKAILVIGTTIFDIVIVMCLIFQNKSYYSVNQINNQKEQNQILTVATNVDENNDTKSSITNSNSVDSTVNSVLVIAEEEIVREEVYENMTIEELSDKLESSLGSDLVGKGNLIATYSLQKSVDPYLATAIMLQETGCAWGECSALVKQCNNVGGQKGSGCNGYSYFPTLDEGIKQFIDNIYKNYVAYGLLTAEDMNSKYAASPTWAQKVNAYIEKIKNN